MGYDYIDSTEKFTRYARRLKEAKNEIVALDFEGEFNLHQYGEKLCLVQVYDGSNAVIIDPFRTSMSQIKRFLQDRSLLKIMYDAPGDRAFLYKNHGIDLQSVLDLKVAVLLLQYEKRDLASVLRETLNFEAGKSKKRYQKYNWNRRPLDRDAIDYALQDVIYLFELKQKLLSHIIGRGLLDSFILKNLQVQNKPHRYNTTPKLLLSGRFLGLSKSEQRVFEQLFRIREETARRLNRPPNAILQNELLFKLAAEKSPITGTILGKRVPAAARAGIVEDINGVLTGK